MKSIIIKVHSFIDVITNSSTEIYCNAKDKALDMVREVINKVLKDSWSDKSFDDLYTIWYVAWGSVEWRDMDNFTKEEIENFKNWKLLTEGEVGKLKDHSYNENWDWLDVKVVSKNSDGVENFAHLFDIFEYSESYN